MTIWQKRFVIVGNLCWIDYLLYEVARSADDLAQKALPMTVLIGLTVLCGGLAVFWERERVRLANRAESPASKQPGVRT